VRLGAAARLWRRRPAAVAASVRPPVHASAENPQRRFEQRHPRLTVAIEATATLVISPLFLAHRAGLISFQTSGQILSLVPGAAGLVLRRAWYKTTLELCGRRLRIGFGTFIRDPRTRFGDDCIVADHAQITRASFGSNALVGDHATIQARARRYDRRDIPLRLHGVEEGRTVNVGDDVWIGAGARVLADVASHSIVGAGAVVVSTFPEWSVLAGVPARVIGERPGAGDR
jgi:virginiamycin A acetyltransferase